MLNAANRRLPFNMDKQCYRLVFYFKFKVRCDTFKLWETPLSFNYYSNVLIH
jgi:hypothetical protein